MTKAFPSLPQSAGRAFEALQAHLEGRPNQIVDQLLEKVTNSMTIGGKERSIRVLGVANPQIDIHHLARALMALQKEDVDGKLLAKARKMARRKSR